MSKKIRALTMRYGVVRAELSGFSAGCTGAAAAGAPGADVPPGSKTTLWFESNTRTLPVERRTAGIPNAEPAVIKLGPALQRSVVGS
jgi:hypothetical protein